MAEEEAPKAWSFADQNKDEQAVALAALVLDQCGEGDDKFAPEKFEAVLKAAGLSVAPAHLAPRGVEAHARRRPSAAL